MNSDEAYADEDFDDWNIAVITDFDALMQVPGFQEWMALNSVIIDGETSWSAPSTPIFVYHGGADADLPRTSSASSRYAPFEWLWDSAFQRTTHRSGFGYFKLSFKFPIFQNIQMGLTLANHIQPHA